MITKKKSQPKPEAEPKLQQEAELAVIGCVLVDPSRFDLVRAIVVADDFENDEHRALFGALERLADAGHALGDLLAVKAGLERLQVLHLVGGMAGVVAAFQSVPHSGNVEIYAKVVAASAVLRHQTKVAQELTKRAQEPGADPAANRLWVEAQLAARVRASDSPVRMAGEIAVDSVAAIKADREAFHRPGVMTGLYLFDRTFGALHAGELVVLAARPSIGKTALGLQIAEHAAERGRRSLVVSLEMRDRELVDRILSNAAQLDSRKIRERRLTHDEIENLANAAESMRDLPLCVWAPPLATMQQIRGIARLENARERLSFLVVDYLGLVRPADPWRPRHEQVAEISAALKSLAKELDVPILALCQLNRQAEEDRPTLAMLRDSGAIEQDADMVMFLHKERRDSDLATLIIGKNRNGDTGEITLAWDAATTHFRDPNQPRAFEELEAFNAGARG